MPRLPKTLRARGPRAVFFVATAFSSVFGAITVECPPAYEPLAHDRGRVTGELAKGKGDRAAGPDGTEQPAALLGTLVHIHTNEHLLLTASEPTDARFTSFLADHVTDSTEPIDPRLLGLLRKLAVAHPDARFEMVSGYRSTKLNESRRKKGRHVASHSQHSLGQAVDFRVVPKGATHGVHPRALEKEIRALGWDGGVGVYTLESDWFVHADVGKNRRWSG
jgi:uncharacterized protein YcbK (DUF882 family)